MSQSFAVPNVETMRSDASVGTAHVSRAEALGLWYDVTLGSVRSETPDLTARQMAVLFTVYLTPAPHTVRSLALHLDVTKAVITRALDALGRFGFVHWLSLLYGSLPLRRSSV